MNKPINESFVYRSVTITYPRGTDLEEFVLWFVREAERHHIDTERKGYRTKHPEFEYRKKLAEKNLKEYKAQSYLDSLTPMERARHDAEYL